MESPSKRWPEAIFEGDDLDQLRCDFRSCKHAIVQWVENHYADGTSCGETPEMAALLIGHFAYMNHKEDDYFVQIIEGIEGDEGKKLAKGYIGIQAIEKADC